MPAFVYQLVDLILENKYAFLIIINYLQGFHGDGFKCSPQVSCRRDPSVCSRNATCIALGKNEFTCICNEGFTGDGNECRPRPKHESNFLLVNQGMAIHRIPFHPTTNKPGSPIFLTYSQMAIALDIDCARGRVYVSDIAGKNA